MNSKLGELEVSNWSRVTDTRLGIVVWFLFFYNYSISIPFCVLNSIPIPESIPPPSPATNSRRCSPTSSAAADIFLLKDAVLVLAVPWIRAMWSQVTMMRREELREPEMRRI